VNSVKCDRRALETKNLTARSTRKTADGRLQ